MPRFPRFDVDYHEIHLAPMNASPISDPNATPGMLQLADDGTSLIIETGIAMGPVTIEIELTDRAPDQSLVSALQAWEDGADVTLRITEPLYLSAPTVLNDIFDPVIVASQPGNYRVRVLARGRHTHDGETVEDVFEEYQVTVWRDIA